jgi:hypothetical protein
MTPSLELLKKDLKYLDKIIDQYKEDLYTVNEIIELSGKEISVAVAQHSGWLVYYDQKSIEVKYLKEYMEVKLAEVQGQLWIKYTEKMDRDLNDKAKTQYINQHPDYLNTKEQFLKIAELYEQYEVINNGFKSRGYALNNLTKLLSTQNNEWTIS